MGGRHPPPSTPDYTPAQANLWDAQLIIDMIQTRDSARTFCRDFKLVFQQSWDEGLPLSGCLLRLGETMLEWMNMSKLTRYFWYLLATWKTLLIICMTDCNSAYILIFSRNIWWANVLRYGWRVNFRRVAVILKCIHPIWLRAGFVSDCELKICMWLCAYNAWHSINWNNMTGAL